MKELIGKKLKAYDMDLDCFRIGIVRNITGKHYILEVVPEEKRHTNNFRYMYWDIADASFSVLNKICS